MNVGDHYEITVEGCLGPEWSAWFNDLEIENEPCGFTRLKGRLADQAALHGILAKVASLGLPLLSVRKIGCVLTD